MKKLALFLFVAYCFLIQEMHAHMPRPVFNRIDQFLITQIDSAKHSIEVCVFIFEWQPIADALVRAKKRGIEVSLVTDNRSLSAKMVGGAELNMPALEYLTGYDIPVYVWTKDRAIMHNKFIIIDNYKILLGSYNFQEAATFRNKENFLLLEDTALSQLYGREYNNVKNEAILFNREMIQKKARAKNYKMMLLILSGLINVFLLFLLYKLKKRTKSS